MSSPSPSEAESRRPWFRSPLTAYGTLPRPTVEAIHTAPHPRSTLYEEKLNSRFSLSIQAEILKLHCLLDDDELELPDTRQKLSLLRDLGGSSVYRRMFDPLGFVSVGNSALSVGLGAAMLVSQLTPANSFFLALSLGFMALDEIDGWYGKRPGAFGRGFVELSLAADRSAKPSSTTTSLATRSCGSRICSR